MMYENGTYYGGESSNDRNHGRGDQYPHNHHQMHRQIQQNLLTTEDEDTEDGNCMLILNNPTSSSIGGGPSLDQFDDSNLHASIDDDPFVTGRF